MHVNRLSFFSFFFFFRVSLRQSKNAFIEAAVRGPVNFSESFLLGRHSAVLFSEFLRCFKIEYSYKFYGPILHDSRKFLTLFMCAYVKTSSIFCKDHRNSKEVPDPIVKDLISDKI